MSIRFAAILTGAIALATPGQAGPLEQPEGMVILTVTGAVSETNAPEGAQFDLAMLEALAGTQITTDTPWYDGERTFEGPLISAILEAVGAEGETLKVTAINDYSAEIPVSDVTTYPVILATRINGETMSIRDKGPSFVIYPFDRSPALYTELYFGRSVWQVKSIEVN
ncbi:hypothetical protein [Amaricoccus macauensis]|uniref:hypothetical protein n=1 Tax=Amaricoccus macauensis TaxID=57001 RepID=UPI003C7A42D0